MTRRLILMRHAKSSWGDPTLPDHARPLNGRGRRSAKALGNWLRENGYTPDEVLCSSSSRTRETLDRLTLDAPTTFLDSLYHASPRSMFNELTRATGACVLMLGHNPGIAGFAESILATPPEHPRFHDYPTCATLVADFDIKNWSDMTKASGTPLAFVIPRELTG
ncbi:histidine phosphatase family protein [Roseovarius sp. MMSF_3281]|uniref:SixA phosphatase family protein n=1 Tax=Roseovarius sp. MMSF_3281 TaxID=3046694 RepID=UPI00273DFB15|nr:histidine phosphatase family protein [Roseovarius sp. MMSF_3281]